MEDFNFIIHSLHLHFLHSSIISKYGCGLHSLFVFNRFLQCLFPTFAITFFITNSKLKLKQLQ